MAGNKLGGKKAAATNLERYGLDHYARIGSIGGSKRVAKGFGSNKVGSDGLTGADRAAIVGTIGGRISRRRKKS